MSASTKTRCWVHLILGTEGNQKFLANYDVRKSVASYLITYAESQNLLMNCVYVNADHIHTLIDLPSDLSLFQISSMIKNASADWINKNGLIDSRFLWSEDFAAFSVSQSNIQAVSDYILSQDDHHRSESYEEELEHFFQGYGIE